MGMPIIGAISLINDLIGKTALAAVDSTVYLASVVLKAISLWTQMNDMMGQFPYMITQPDLDQTLVGSSLLSLL
eukprot:13840161-Ditylum_brightwellii.AAC.1